MRVAEEVDEAVDLDDGNVVVENARGELRVHLDAEHVQLDVGVELGVVVDVPLTQPDPQLFGPAVQGGQPKYGDCKVFQTQYR